MRGHFRRTATWVALSVLSAGWVAVLPQPAIPSTPLRVDGSFIYDTNDQLFRRYPSRFAGTDLGSAHNIAHDQYGLEIVERLRAMVTPLGGYAEMRPFASEGSNFGNIVAVVPGVDPVLKNQFVVLGGHWDCVQTHLDGAIDCGMQIAVDLGIVRAFTDYWRNNGIRPQRTLMILFTDGEEQCLCGSVDFTTIGTYLGMSHLELPPQVSVAAYHNTDMIGANFPGRYFGKSTNDFMPLNVFSAPVYDPSTPDSAVRALPAYLTPGVLGNLGRFRLYREAMLAARDRLFEDMRTKFGRATVTYADGGVRPLFTDEQKRYINIIDDPLDRSDHAVLILQGIPSDLSIGLVDPTASPPGLLQYHNSETLEFLNWMYSGQQRRSPLTELGMETAGMFVAYMLGANHADAGLFQLGEVHV